jgi:hypothetical protein
MRAARTLQPSAAAMINGTECLPDAFDVSVPPLLVILTEPFVVCLSKAGVSSIDNVLATLSIGCFPLLNPLGMSFFVSSLSDTRLGYILLFRPSTRFLGLLRICRIPLPRSLPEFLGVALVSGLEACITRGRKANLALGIPTTRVLVLDVEVVQALENLARSTAACSGRERIVVREWQEELTAWYTWHA